MTASTKTALEHMLTSTHKVQMIAHMRSHPEDFPEALKLALTEKQPYSWRAAWVLWGCMDKNDPRIRRHIKKIINIIPQRKDNQQRELLMILQRMEINQEDEGKLFDVCVAIWEKTGNTPSLRINALKLLISIAKKHPDLLNEIKSLTESHYTESLSPGAKKSMQNLTKNLI